MINNILSQIKANSFEIFDIQNFKHIQHCDQLLLDLDSTLDPYKILKRNLNYCKKILKCSNDIEELVQISKQESTKQTSQSNIVKLYEDNLESDLDYHFLVIEAQLWVEKSRYLQFNNIFLNFKQSEQNKNYEFTHLIDEESCNEQKFLKLEFNGVFQMLQLKLNLNLVIQKSSHQLYLQDELQPLNQSILISKLKIKRYPDLNKILDPKSYFENNQQECLNKGMVFESKLQWCIHQRQICKEGQIFNQERGICAETCSKNEYQYYSEEIQQYFCIKGFNTCSENLLPGCRICDVKNTICLSCYSGYLLLDDKCSLQINKRISNYLLISQINDTNDEWLQTRKDNHQTINLNQKSTQSNRILTGCPNQGVNGCNTFDTANRLCTECCTSYNKVGKYCQDCPQGMSWDTLSGGCQFIYKINLSLPLGCRQETADNTKCQYCFTSYQLGGSGLLCNLQCLQNQTKVSGACTDCIKSIPNCNKCHNSLVCHECQNDLVLFPYKDRKSSSAKSNTCVGKCPPEFYLKDNICQPCGARCSECKFSTTLAQPVCNTCKIGYVMQVDGVNCQKERVGCNQNCICTDKSNYFCDDCEDGYYLDDEECIACVSGCKQCLNETTCQICFSNNYKVGEVCYVICENTYYRDSTANECTNCVLGCKICSSPYLCDECLPGFKFDNSYMNCIPIVCPEGTYLSGSSCLPCINNCKICNDSMSCSTCFFDSVFNGSSCLANLQAGCPDNCITCTGDQQCQNCIEGYFINQNVLENTCQPCQDNCILCSSSDNCVQCQSGFQLIQGQCKLICDFGYYEDSACILCSDLNCIDCTISECLKCKSGYYLENNSCVKLDCQLGYFKNSQNECEQCSNGCMICTQNDKCDTCFPNFEKTGQECIQCAENCIKCNNQQGKCLQCFKHYIYDDLSSLCILKCEKGFFKLQNTCQQCPSHCEECSSQTTCDVCSQGYTLFPDVCVFKPTCVSNQIYNPITNSCMNCERNCLKCEFSVTNCIQCDTNNGWVLLNANCVVKTNCIPKQYYIPSTNTCGNCSQNCLICNSDTDCTKCDEGNGFIIQGGFCVLKRICLSNQYYISSNNSCENCSSNCLQCSDKSTCSKCDELNEYLLISGYCQKKEICKSNQFYISKDNTCRNCSSFCLSCESDTNCTQCDEGNGYIIQGGLCVPKMICLSNQYYISGNNSCGNCSSNCIQCSDNRACNHCDELNGFILFSGQCIKKEICKSNQYYISKDNTCGDCSSFCLSCESDTICTKCDESNKYFLVKGNCALINCASNQYYSPTLNQCDYCQSNCLECTNESACTKCDELKNFYLINSNCVQVSKCGDGNINLPILVNQLIQNKECDDKNIQDGDGCSSICKLEKGYECTFDNSPSIQSSICTELKTKNSFNLKSDIDENGNPTVTILFSKQIKILKNLGSTSDYNDKELIDYIQNYLIIQVESLTSSDYSYTITVNTDKTGLILTFIMNKNVKNKKIQVSIDSDQFESVNNIENISSKGVFPDYVTISETEKQTAKDASAVTNAVSQSIVATVVPIILFANFSLLFNALDLFQMILYLQYVNIRLPFNILAFIEIMTNFQIPISLNIFQYLINEYPIQEADLPAGFERQGAESIFLINTGDSITQIIIITLIHIILKLFVKFTSNLEKGCLYKCNNYLKEKLYTSWEWGWYLDMYWEMFLSLIVGGFLQFKQLEAVDGMSAFNSIVTVIVFCFAVLSPIIFWKIIYKNKQSLHDKKILYQWGMLYESLSIQITTQVIPLQPNESTLELAKKPTQANIIMGGGDATKTTQIQHFQSFSVAIDLEKRKSYLSNEQKNNQIQNAQSAQNYIKSKRNLNYFDIKQVSLAQRMAKYYFIILYLRKLFFGIFIVLMHDSTIAQLIMIDFLNIILILFLLIAKPYKSISENIKAIICEIFMVIAQFSLKFLVSDKDSQLESERINIGWIFNVCVIGILAVQFVFIFYNLIREIYQMIGLFYQKCKKKSKNHSLQNESPNEKEDSEKSVLSYQQKKPNDNNNQGLINKNIESINNDVTEQYIITPKPNSISFREISQTKMDIQLQDMMDFSNNNCLPPQIDESRNDITQSNQLEENQDIDNQINIPNTEEQRQKQQQETTYHNMIENL